MTAIVVNNTPSTVTASRLLGRGSAAGNGAPVEITLGSGLTMSGTTVSASGGSGITIGQAYAHVLNRAMI